MTFVTLSKTIPSAMSGPNRIRFLVRSPESHEANIAVYFKEPLPLQYRKA
eukprot:CAMPEP_0113868626 /NCGR_PEP_ID=MMETSP0780_2-20120614/1093_1 /TAXON_ID=652834 /ORGANISM="Palpitomonas bilix" /LENGTH=49 /DNA_ID=CAMNT_0000853729 /DNA_START=96 /DNA_END=242 /DNA_ORIENTATION=+ /assembly_acc=CAM_ASM_000599